MLLFISVLLRLVQIKDEGSRMKNILEYLEQSAVQYPDKIAVRDPQGMDTYTELKDNAKRAGSYFLKYESTRRPIAVFMEKSVRVLELFMGIVYSGNFYVLIDPSFPIERINRILEVLNPLCVVTIEENVAKLNETVYKGNIILENEASADINENGLAIIRGGMMETDPLYGIFTSGSTGVPKCVLVGHSSVIDFINVFTDTFNITDSDVIGNQAPFDFDVSVKDIYSCLKAGATLVIIPKSYFMFPTAVMDWLDETKVTTLIWAVSALCLLNRLHGLKYKQLDNLNKVLFSGEAMPLKQLRQWREYYPQATFVNLYGPTEITCNCTYEIIDREYEDDDKLPIGKAFNNERVFLLSKNDDLITDADITGEICVAGRCLALGYYNNEEANAKAFTPNPANKQYYERIYRTGDLGYYCADGKLYFAGRKDFQIKHMGHRIELEEIDSAVNKVNGIERSLCFFDEVKNKIVCIYEGSLEPKDLKAELKNSIPDWMVPNVMLPIDEMPLNKNGKTDRGVLKEYYRERKG